MIIEENKNRYLAKSNGETICEHTEKLLSDFAYLLELYGDKFDEKEKEIIKFLATYHDVGKMNSRFQNKIMKIMGENCVLGSNLDEIYAKYGVEEIPHGIISAAAVDFDDIEERYGERLAEIMISVIACHHKRKALDVNGKYVNSIAVNEICKAEIESFGKDIKFNEFNIYQLLVSPHDSTNSIVNEEDYIAFAKYKGALNKVDYSASGNVVCEIKSDNAQWKVNEYFNQNNYKKNDCQQFLEANHDKNCIVIASTGIGKTEASLLWGGDSKIFYTLPLKVAINSIYDRIKTQYYDSEKVVFLHSDTLTSMIENDMENDSEASFKKYSLIKSFAYPLTVCTVDQLFTFVMKSIGTEILPFTLSYSKLVIDEIQAYSKEILAYLIYGISVISKMGGKFLIMTATLPPFIPTLLKNEGVEFELPSSPFYKLDNEGNQIQRHYIKYEKTNIDIDKAIELSQSNKVLIVVNTVFSAQELYSEICERTSNVELLHSRFMQMDRRLKEEQILQFAKSQDNGIWISTQIVEASLDIDFDILMTEMCSADSLMQRLGRCYRNRVYNGSQPNCYIYDTENGKGTIYDKEIYTRSVNELAKYDGKMFVESDKVDYVNAVYDEKALANTYVKDIKRLIKKLKQYPLDYIEKAQAENEFRNIQSVNLLTHDSYNLLKNTGVVEKLLNGSREEKIKARAELQRHSISVAESTVKYSKKANINIAKTEMVGYYVTDNIYNSQQGLCSDTDSEVGFI